MDLRDTPVGGVTPTGAAETAEEHDDTSLVRLVGRSRAFRLVAMHIERAAGSDVPVLLHGETGTGKGIAAHAIHELSARKSGPFVTVHTAEKPKEALEAELVSAFEKAAGGTLYIDEVGTLDEKTQALLLRALETREVQKAGEPQPRRIDCRIIASTVHDLKAKVDSGALREDIYYRLQVFAISIPPLRERKEDIPRLSRRFLQELATEAGQAQGRSLTPASLEVLKRYRWPGNILELRTAIRTAAQAAGASPVIEPEHLPEAVRSATPSLEAVTIPIGTTLEEAERTIIQRTVEATNGNKKEAAKILGISRSALYAKLKRLDIEL
jgi:DNA-binding NtrC family response regulator